MGDSYSETDLDITGLELWEVLHALHANTQAVGLESRKLVDELAELPGLRFDYVHALKFGIVKTSERTWLHRVDLYDRDSRVPARVVIEALRKRSSQR